MRESPKDISDVSLVLSSGGARGLAHIGVIQELTNRGYRIRSIAGSSMGALVGGLYAAGKLEEYEEWVVGLDKLDILRMIDFTLTDVGFIKGERVFEEMGKLGLIPDLRIEELKIPYAAVAVDILQNRERVFKSGSLLRAIRASIAIPLVFTPVQDQEGILVDGGVLCPLPLDYVERTGTDLLVAVDLNALIPYVPARDDNLSKKKGNDGGGSSASRSARGTLSQGLKSKNIRELFKRWDELFGHRFSGWVSETDTPQTDREEKIGSFDLIMRSVQLMQHRLTTHALQRTPPDILVQVSRECSTVFEFYRAKELIEYGRSVCAAALDRYERGKKE